MHLVAYFDEAGTHDQSTFMVMGGYLARIGQWTRLSGKWNKHLRRNELDCFHLIDINNRLAAPHRYPDWTEERHQRFMETCAKIIDDNTIVGINVRLERTDYENYFQMADKPNKVRFDTMYGLCFHFCVVASCDLAKDHEGSDNFTIDFIVEDGHRHIGDAQRIFGELRAANIPGISNHLGAMKPASKKKFAGLQCADGNASGIWQLADSVEKSAPPPNARLEDYRKIAGSRSPLVQYSLNRRLLSKLQRRLLDFEEQRRAGAAKFG